MTEDGLDRLAMRFARDDVPYAQQRPSAMQKSLEQTARVQLSEYAIMAQETAQIIVFSFVAKLQPLLLHEVIILDRLGFFLERLAKLPLALFLHSPGARHGI